MRKIQIILVGMALMVSPLLGISQVKLPEKAMGMPEIFINEQESWNWVDVANSHNWGKLTNNFWIVYIDREGAKSYTSSTGGSIEKSNLEFMHPYFVAKIENGYALLYEEKNIQENLEISKKAKSIGWVPVEHLLLWSTCPRTQGQVYQKAVILKDIEAIQNKKDINETSPEFSKNPESFIGSGWRATDLEFYFVYKMVNGSALLVADSKLPEIGEISKEKLGWMKKGLYTSWNERLCYEPNFGEELEASNKIAAIFETKQAAMLFKQNGDYESALWIEKLKSKRWSPKQVRFPVLETSNIGYIAQVGTIGSMGDASNKASSSNREEIERLDRKIDNIEKTMERVNVVFVMDGTSSMKNYYQPMAKALQNAMNQNSMRGAEMYFGAVIYRNYADGDRLTEMKQLTQDFQGVASWLATRECKSIGQSHYEAMYYGIDYALSKMNWNKGNCNFLILVGDAGNDPNDQKGKNMNDIVRKMSDYKINFVAFQANHLNHAAYHDFVFQIQQIMTKELSQLMGRTIKRKDFKLTRQLYQVKSASGEWPIYSSAYRFAEIDKSENANELENIVENKIVDFKKQANEQLKDLRMARDGAGADVNTNDMSTTTIDAERIKKILEKIGLTESDIELLKDRNTTLKVKGYATRNADGLDVFVPCVFMAKAELDELISSLKKVSQNVSTNRRQDLQNALKTLALSYIGQGRDANELNVDEVMEAVSGLTSTTGRNVLSGVNIKDITNPNKVTDSQINDFVNQIKSDVKILERRKVDKSCYFDSKNKQRYYYILLEDMPLQDHNN